MKVKIRMSTSGIPLLHSWYLPQNMRYDHYLSWRPTQDLNTIHFSMLFDRTSHWKKVDNVTQTISVAAIIGCDWKQFGILKLLLKSKLLLTNSSRFPTIKIIYFEVNTVNLWYLIRSRVKEILICGLSPFFTAKTVKMTLGGHVIQNLHY